MPQTLQPDDDTAEVTPAPSSQPPVPATASPSGGQPKRTTGERLVVLETLFITHEDADQQRHNEIKSLVSNLDQRVERGQRLGMYVQFAQLLLVGLAFVTCAVLAGKTLGFEVNAEGAVVGGGSGPLGTRPEAPAPPRNRAKVPEPADPEPDAMLGATNEP